MQQSQPGQTAAASEPTMDINMMAPGIEEENRDVGDLEDPNLDEGTEYSQLAEDVGGGELEYPSEQMEIRIPGRWTGPIEIGKLGQCTEEWKVTLDGYAWHPSLGGGIGPIRKGVYQNLDHDYEPVDDEIQKCPRNNADTVEDPSAGPTTGDPDVQQQMTDPKSGTE